MTSFIAWCSDVCLTKWSKERNSLVSTHLWGWRQSCQSFTASLVLQIVMWRYRDAKEPLTPEEENTKLLLDDNASTHKAWSSRRAKCPCFHPHTLQSRLKVFFLFFSFFLFFLAVMKQKLVGRRFVMATWSVSICRFRDHEFSPHHSTRNAFVRRSWESWNCIARRE